MSRFPRGLARVKNRKGWLYREDEPTYFRVVVGIYTFMGFEKRDPGPDLRETGCGKTVLSIDSLIALHR